MLYIPPSLTDPLLVCFGKPVTEQNLEEVEKAQFKLPNWMGIGLYRSMFQMPGGPVRIYPDGTHSSPSPVLSGYMSNTITGLNMKLPLEYIPDNESESIPLIFYIYYIYLQSYSQ
jgi:hypothetical protein